jgi:hypothetical protein
MSARHWSISGRRTGKPHHGRFGNAARHTGPQSWVTLILYVLRYDPLPHRTALIVQFHEVLAHVFAPFVDQPAAAIAVQVFLCHFDGRLFLSAPLAHLHRRTLAYLRGRRKRYQTVSGVYNTLSLLKNSTDEYILFLLFLLICIAYAEQKMGKMEQSSSQEYRG